MAEAKAIITLAPTVGKPTLRTRMNFAVQHMIAAARFSRMCGEIEYKNTGKPFGPFYDVQIGYVSATIIMAAASLESYINEIWVDSQKYYPELSESIRGQLYELLDRKSILEKYQHSLQIKGKESLPKGKQPYQDTQALIMVRDALVHFRPEWQDEQEEHKKIGENLARKFELNPFIGNSSPIFPERCMSYGCTKWAVMTAQKFIAEFSKITNFENKYVKFLDQINPVYDPNA